MRVQTAGQLRQVKQQHMQAHAITRLSLELELVAMATPLEGGAVEIGRVGKWEGEIG